LNFKSNGALLGSFVSDGGLGVDSGAGFKTGSISDREDSAEFSVLLLDNCGLCRVSGGWEWGSKGKNKRQQAKQQKLMVLFMLFFQGCGDLIKCRNYQIQVFSAIKVNDSF
jgi:hypothetical protein